MKRLTPVTTRATKMGRGAIWYPFTDYNFPETIQSKSTFSKSRSEAGRPRSSKKMRMEVRKARPMAEGPTTLTTVFPRRLPKNPLITKPIDKKPSERDPDPQTEESTRHNQAWSTPLN